MNCYNTACIRVSPKLRHSSIKLNACVSNGCIHQDRGRNSVFGIANRYGLDGWGSNAGGGEIFRTVQTGPWAHPASCTLDTEYLSWAKSDRGRVCFNPLLLALRCEWLGARLPTPLVPSTMTYEYFITI